MRILPEAMTTREIEVNPLDIIYDYLKRKESIEAEITRIIFRENADEVLEVVFPNAEGIRGIIPKAELGFPEPMSTKRLVGQKIIVRIKGVDKQEGLVACTRKEIVDEAKMQLVKFLKEGEEIISVIRAVSKNSIFVDIGGGVVVKVKNVYSVQDIPLYLQFQPLQELKVHIKKVDSEKNLIEVKYINPWDKTSFRRGEFIQGKVVKIFGRNMWIEVKPGIVGRSTFLSRQKIFVGDKVRCRVLTFNQGEKKLNLDLVE